MLPYLLWPVICIAGAPPLICIMFMDSFVFILLFNKLLNRKIRIIEQESVLIKKPETLIITFVITYIVTFFLHWADPEFIPIAMNRYSPREAPCLVLLLRLKLTPRPLVERLHMIHCLKMLEKWLVPSTAPVGILYL